MVNAMKFLLLVLWLPLLACAEIYQWQDPQGQAHYSDQASPNAKILPITPGYSFYTVEKVIDGDTILLSDGRKVRLLGINTPEIAHFNNDADAGGDEAKQWLTHKILHQSVRLVTDAEYTDKYQRTLAYIFTSNDEHINQELVAQGFATVSIYPPNLLYAQELATAQTQAEQMRLGIWDRPEYAPIAMSHFETLALDGQNFRHQWLRLQGRLHNIRYTSTSVYLEFLPHVSARIERHWLDLFPDLQQFVGRNLELRGWLNKNQDRFSMLIRHPSSIKVLHAK